MKQWIKRIVVALGILLLVGAAAFIWWGTHPLAAMPEAQNALQSDSQVQVSNNDWITFLPVENRMDVGVILYPGGHVDPVAYTPLAGGIAAAGFPVIMPRMPLNLAVFDINAADEIMARYPEIETWVIGGHSLGGAMAAEYVSGHETAVRGLFLLASYSAENTDLSRFTNLKVLSIFGSEDGDVAGIHASRGQPSSGHKLGRNGGGQSRPIWLLRRTARGWNRHNFTRSAAGNHSRKHAYFSK